MTVKGWLDEDDESYGSILVAVSHWMIKLANHSVRPRLGGLRLKTYKVRYTSKPLLYDRVSTTREPEYGREN